MIDGIHSHGLKSGRTPLADEATTAEMQYHILKKFKFEGGLGHNWCN
jgi:hypothetical protein